MAVAMLPRQQLYKEKYYYLVRYGRRYLYPQYDEIMAEQNQQKIKRSKERNEGKTQLNKIKTKSKIKRTRTKVDREKTINIYKKTENKGKKAGFILVPDNLGL